MNLHEYQAKELLAKYGLPVQQGVLATNGEEAAAAFDKLGGKFAVIKAQVHAGGRGKAGGVKVVKSRDEAAEVAKNLIGKNLVTYQTGWLCSEPAKQATMNTTAWDGSS